MLVLQKAYRRIFFLLALTCAPLCIYSDNNPESLDYVNATTEVIENEMINQSIPIENDFVDQSREKVARTPNKLSYYLYVEDFIKSFIEIPTANVLDDSSTITSKYLAGRAPIYNTRGENAGICSASFLCMKNKDGIFTDIANYLSVDNGLIVTWFTPTRLINLKLDSVIHSMVTECIVVASTKVGFNPFYGNTFNMVVSSDDKKVYFTLTQVSGGRLH